MTSNGVPMNNLPVLGEKNFDRWHVQMKALLGFQDVYEIVMSGYQEPSASATEAQRSTYKDLKKKDCKALFLIHHDYHTPQSDEVLWRTD